MLRLISRAWRLQELKVSYRQSSFFLVWSSAQAAYRAGKVYPRYFIPTADSPLEYDLN
jgi:hypothetical protein